MLVIVVLVGLIIFGVIVLGRTLTPAQRVGLVLTVLCGFVWLTMWLISHGLLGRVTK